MSSEFINFKKLTKRITQVQEELAQLLHLESLLKPKAKRGRKAGTKVAAKAPKAKAKKTRAKRGAIGESILKFLATKGKEGAHAKDIANDVGTNPKNITAYFYGTGAKVKGVKRLGGNKFSYVPAE